MIKSFVFYAFVLMCLLGFSCVSIAEPVYFVCGPDEDGCTLDDPRYCACIPYDVIHVQEQYCLDFDTMQCHPLSSVPHCSSSLIFKDQGRCLATIYQSEPEPPCSMMPKSFCIQHHLSLCDVNGDPMSCKRE